MCVCVFESTGKANNKRKVLEDISNQPAYRQIIHRLQDELALLDVADDQDPAGTAATPATAAAAVAPPAVAAVTAVGIRRDAAPVGNQTPQPIASLARNCYSIFFRSNNLVEADQTVFKKECQKKKNSFMANGESPDTSENLPRIP